MLNRAMNGNRDSASPSRHLPMKAGSSSSITRWRSNRPRSCQSLLLSGTVSTVLAWSCAVSRLGWAEGRRSSRLMI
ncbi:hypothetical protein D3C81_2065850 [compost metagenome]